MPQLIRKGPFLTCPKTGRIIGMHSVRWRWLFPIIGFLALVWYLIRVLPKPSRAMYPCQRVAAPLASGFVSYIVGWLILVFGFRQLRLNLRRADYLAVAVSVLVMGIGVMLSLPPDRANALGFVPAEGTNNPMGVGRGIHPGRVVWTHAPEAATWNGLNGYWWEDAYNNQPVIDKMVSETVRSLTDATTDGAAWEALFRHFNQTKGRGDVGYVAGEKIAIKINLNNTETDRAGNPQELIDNQLDPSPHMVLALLRQLVYQANVPQECITIFDAVRYFPDIIFNKCKGAYPGLGGEFPNVVCLDKIGGRGRAQAQWTANAIQFSRTNDCSPNVVSCLVDATYVINVALLKGHVYAGATLTAKNHYGSLFQSEYGFNRDHSYLVSNQTSYAPLVDINGSRHIGGKTMLLMFDALYAAQTQGFVDEVTARNLPARFKNPPFNYGWTSSMFASQDPVAIDSVGLDFLSSEDGFIPQDSYTTRRPDNFLHEAAMAPNSPSGTVYTPDGAGFPLASLGVHEHWNNVKDRQYSRNLGRPNGIELVSVLVAPTRSWTLNTSVAGSGNVQGAGTYLSQATATLTAVPSPGNLFIGWTGDASGTTNPLGILMNSNKTVGATFIPDSGGSGVGAPVAAGDSYSASANLSLVVPAMGVLTNDANPNGGALTASLVTGPQHGVLTLNSNGGFTYTPAPGFNGADLFSYRANNGIANSNAATVSLTVTGPSQMVVNGSFESGLSGWTTSGSPNTVKTNSTMPARDGVTLVEFNSGNTPNDGVLSQTFATSAGTTYTVTFEMGVLAYSNSPQVIELTATGSGNLASQTFSRNGSGNGSIVWTTQTMNFTANSNSTTLTFRDRSTSTFAIDLLLDHVRVTPTGGTAPIQRALTVASSGASSVAITASPADVNGSAGGNTGFGRTYNDGTAVTLTAPATSGGANFSKWQKNGTDLTTNTSASVTMDANHTLTAVYTTTPTVPVAFVNGSFESGFTGWTTSGSPNTVKVNSTMPARDGVTLVEINSSNSPNDGVLSQTFATTAGATYVVTFEMGVLSYPNSPQVLEVSATGSGSPVSQTFSMTGPGNGATRWATQTMQFIANSSATTLTFKDRSTVTNAIDLLLDHVRVVTDAPPPVQRNLTVASSGASSVAITASPADTNGNAGGNTGFSRSYNDGTLVSLTAPAVSSGANFSKWQKNGTDLTTNTTTSVTMDGNYTLTAVYTAAPPAPASFVNGSFEDGTNGWSFTGSHRVIQSIDGYQATDGTTLVVLNGGQEAPSGVLTQTFATVAGQTYLLDFDQGATGQAGLQQRLEVTVTGAATLLSRIDTITCLGSPNGNWLGRSATFVADSAATTLRFADVSTSGDNVDLLLDHVRVVADNGPVPVQRTLTVASSGASSVAITASPADVNGNAGGNTGFGRTYNDGTAVTLTAPATSGGANFSKWQKNGADLTTNTTANVTMDGNHTLTAVYTTAPPVPTNLVNGSFEDGENGWTITGSRRVIPSIDAYQATDGNILMVMNGGQETPSGVVSQTFATVAGQSYNLLMDIGVVGGQGVPQRLRVTLAGTSNLVTREETLLGSGSGAAWTPTVIPFTANSATTTLTFSDISASTNNADLLVDNLRVIPSTARSLTVESTAGTGVNITVTPLDSLGNGSGATRFSRYYNLNTSVNLSAPSSFAGSAFIKWRKNGTDFSTNTNISVTLDADVTMTAVYAAPVQLLTNGSFENGFAAWTASGNQLISSVSQPSDGLNVVEFNGGNSEPNAVLSQAFATVAGQTYYLYFDLGAIAYNTSLQTLRVSVDGTGNLLSRDIVRLGSGDGSTRWFTESLTFVADGPSTTLTFRDVSPTSNVIDMLLDNVRVTGGPDLRRALVVASSGASSVAITASPADVNGNSGGNTEFNRSYNNGAQVSLTAPATSGGMIFSKWQENGVDLTTAATANVTMDSNHTLTAVYIPAPPPPSGFVNGSFENDFTGWTTTGGTNGVKITSLIPARDGVKLVEFNSSNSVPDGKLVQTFGTTPGATYNLTFDLGVVAYSNNPQSMLVEVNGVGSLISQTVSVNGIGNGAVRWVPQSFTFVADGSSTTLALTDKSTSTIAIDMLLDNVKVVTEGGPPVPVQRTLTVASSGATSVAITASPADLNSNAGGNTLFGRTYDTGTVVTLTAPAVSGGANFSKWQKNGADLTTNTTAILTMDDNQTLTAVYVGAPPPPLTFVNGSFESGFTGWTPSGSPDTVKVNSILPARDGVSLVEFNSSNSPNDGVLSQTFATTAGVTYGVTFEMGVLSYPTSAQVMEVNATGSSSLVTRSFSMNGPGNGATRWATQTMEFTADSGQTTLTFRDRSTSTFAIDMLLDHVRVVTAGGPPAPVQRTLTVASSGASSVAITASPADVNGNAGGNTGFGRTYNDGTAVTLTAPATSGGANFSKWQKNGVDLTTNTSASVTMDANHTLTAVYTATPTVPVAFVNGSFESGFTGWTTAGSPNTVKVNSILPARDGVTLVEFNSSNSPNDGVLSQTFATTVGVSYSVAFEMGVLSYPTSAQVMEVNATGSGSLVTRSFSMNGPGNGATRWATQTVQFTATSTATTLTFRDRSTSTIAIDLLLDHVRVTSASPAPAASLPAGDSEPTADPLPGLADGNTTTVDTGWDTPPTPSIGGTPGDMRIGFSLAPAGLYVLERSIDLKSWTYHSEIEITEPGPVEFTDDEAAPEKLFYRIGRSAPAGQ